MESPEVVHKFPLPLSGWGVVSSVQHCVEMPANATVLALQLQRGVPTLWAQVDPRGPAVTRTFRWVGTGSEVPSGGEYIGTAQMQGGDFVFHLYEVTS